jgi:hypothetical protein
MPSAPVGATGILEQNRILELAFRHNPELGCSSLRVYSHSLKLIFVLFANFFLPLPIVFFAKFI